MAARPRVRERISSPVDHDARWRPRQRAGTICNYTLRGKTCRKRGAHYCEPRADKVVFFFAEILVHTKGAWAGLLFVLEWWQEHDVVRPLFGEVIWDPELRLYRRRYSLAYIIVGRKNGKSELAAGIVLYLLIGDDEEAAEVYGAAKDTKQAGKVAEVVNAMRVKSPLLNGDRGSMGRLEFNKNSRRIYDEKTSSYFEVITADAKGELGHNPHGWYIDEVLSQLDGKLFTTLRTSEGTRHQMLGLMITTETNDPAGFGASEIDEAERVQEDPRRAPHTFVYCRKLPATQMELERLHALYPGNPDLPVSLDPFDEANWRWPNPALGSFKRIATMRTQAIEAQNEPSKEVDFRQYQLNQRQQNKSRWISLLVWDDAGAGARWPAIDEEKLRGKRCYGGLDLAASTDLAALTWNFPKRWLGPNAKASKMLWRFWVPEENVRFFDERLAGQFSQWINEGWLRVTEGDVIDFEQIRADIAADLKKFTAMELGYDPWGAPDMVQWLQDRGLTVYPVRQTYEGLSAAMHELMHRTKSHEIDHGGNPVARWMAGVVEVKHPADQPDVVKPVKPKRDTLVARIDGIVSAVMSIAAETREHQVEPEPALASASTGRTSELFRPTQRLKL